MTRFVLLQIADLLVMDMAWIQWSLQWKEV